MRRGTTAAPAGSDDVDAEPGLGAVGGMSTAVVRRDQLHVLVAFSPIDLVLDAVIGEVHLAVEVRELMLPRPAADLVVIAVGSSVAVGPIAIVVLEEFLVIA